MKIEIEDWAGCLREAGLPITEAARAIADLKRRREEMLARLDAEIEAARSRLSARIDGAWSKEEQRDAISWAREDAA